MQEEICQIAGKTDSKTNHQHCFYETLQSLWDSDTPSAHPPPFRLRVDLCRPKDRSQQYTEPLILIWAAIMFFFFLTQFLNVTPFVFNLPTEPIWIRGINTLTPRYGKPWRRRTSKRWWVATTRLCRLNARTLCIASSRVPSHLCVTSRRWASCLIRCSRRWWRTERTSPWGNGSFSVWPGPCCATARC